MVVLNIPEYSEYASILEKQGLSVTRNFPWIFVGYTKITQGWKIHLSSIITEAESLLSLVIPILQKRNIPFKCAFNKEILIQINEGSMGSTAVGKFITIYPNSDEESRLISDELIDKTKGFHGPVILTDLKLGDVVYVRYGAFNAIIQENRVGIKTRLIYRPNGTLISDQYTIPFKTPPGIVNPFSNRIGKNLNRSIENKIIGPGYILVNTIKKRSRGSVFWAVDVRNKHNIQPKIIKEGRCYCLSDEYGRDMRYRLRFQEQLHKKLHDVIPIPNSDPYFEVDDNGYLPLDFVKGESFLSIIQKNPWRIMSNDQRKRILALLQKVLRVTSKLHKVNYVHRDLTLQNIWVNNSDEIYLLDLELAYELSSEQPPIRGGTSGFVSMRQKNNFQPSFSDDIFTLGADMVFLFTGIEPRKIFYTEKSKRLEQLDSLVDGLPLEFVEIIARCVDDVEDTRPKLEEIMNILDKTVTQYDKENHIYNKFHTRHGDIPDSIILARQCVESGINGILSDTITQSDTGLWLTPTGKVTDTVGVYELKGDGYKGIAGVLYLFSKAKRLGFTNQDMERKSSQAVKWLLDSKEATENQMPGLYFGKSGIAVALAEAISSGLIERSQKLYDFILDSLNGNIDMLDMTHGAAGQGLAVLNTSILLNAPEITALSHRFANYLLDAQNNEGNWPVFVNSDSTNDIYIGFAHGVSGIIYFLAEYAKQFRDQRAEQACRKGMEWLMNQGIISENDEIEWPRSSASKVVGKWWCHGSIGIALTFLKMYELTQEKTYQDMLNRILTHYSNHIVDSNFGFCHGISGIGGVFLEANRLLNEKKWYEMAYRIVKILNSTYKTGPNNGHTWLVDDPYLPTADLMIGSGGIVYFLLQFYSNSKIGFPLLSEP